NGTTYSVTSIGGSAFRDCSGLTSVTIPNSVTSIGEGAFYRCSSLTSVTLPNNATIHSESFIEAGEKPTIDSVIYCNDTLIVGNYTLIGTGFLTIYLNGNSYFPSNNAVVFDCYESKSGDLIIPSTISYNGTTYSVTSIGGSAFAYCSGLTSVTIPNSVTSIGQSAFSGCNGLTSIVSNAVVPPALGNEVFPNPNSCNVTVPCGSLEAYTSSQWNNYFPNRIEEDCSSALQEVESTREFVVYPNPARGFAIVEFEALQEHSLLRIADLGGRVIKTFDLSAGTESLRLDLRDLPSGVYTLMIGNTTKKLIVE
ncbi:MAG: leucine-rich repeat protein, partial [Candidatus Onthomorpha sp.]|nr:leucine-rich repeat protein [Candidatus Onthomorpha sp.]